MSNVDSVCMSVKKLAEVLDVSPTTAWGLIKDRKIAHSKVGRRTIVTQPQLKDYLARTEVPAVNAKSVAQRLIRSIK